ncbi:hypothetical protein OE88DRAFT_1669096 [Heliocybe sulcata]|uniref:Uncharacterized protein n=1 Tax=Heliocybe sulcata TaxID=5364 RepID=A0A5C3MJK4_9AGAM|nr:hypothetical protein OE88DRAFT_1669096 [Heliocybe sulcata]
MNDGVGLSYSQPRIFDFCPSFAHASSSLARFTYPLPALTLTSATPFANIIYQAGCEVTSHCTCDPIGLAMSADNMCLALNAAGGYKNRDPILRFFLLDERHERAAKFPAGVGVNVGLSQVARSARSTSGTAGECWTSSAGDANVLSTAC